MPNTVMTATCSDDGEAPSFKLGDLVRFMNGPVMTVVELERDLVRCFWWSGPELLSGIFPSQLLIHVQVVNVVEDTNYTESYGPATDTEELYLESFPVVPPEEHVVLTIPKSIFSLAVRIANEQ